MFQIDDIEKRRQDLLIVKYGNDVFQDFCCSLGSFLMEDFAKEIELYLRINPAFRKFQCEFCGSMFIGTHFQAKTAGWVFHVHFDHCSTPGDVCPECMKKKAVNPEGDSYAHHKEAIKHQD